MIPLLYFTFSANKCIEIFFSVMALKPPIRFPLFAPLLDPRPNSNPNQQRLATEVRFSRWNNANAEKFNQRRREQEQIEYEIRRERRFNSITKIVNITDDEHHSSPTATSSVETFKSIGTPSAPSAPSIPGKKSKYSKSPEPYVESHPAFRVSNAPKSSEKPVNAPANVKIAEDGVSYLIDGAPFEFKYSYTETPKLKPIKMREPPFVPFGPTTMPRPWTGRAPLPPSKKKLKEFDSFVLPPPDKKGVKPVQKPGPFLPGTAPRYVQTREEIMGEPLTPEEIDNMIKGCIKANRQLNIGRDGLTHNMLENIHAHWKRRRVCKIKCKGVCTVDMDNVCQQLEERTGGKIIFRRGGVLFLFRGRNYNYKTRSRFPLMLWKPVPPVYPRLIKRVPEGLTLEEAIEMRKKGKHLIPIRKLAKNGVYCDLVRHVREAFEECELVRINCQGLNSSDYRRIGAKLRDLVPCVLLSFENEHILIWRGQNWKSSLPNLKDSCEEANNNGIDSENSTTLPLEAPEVPEPLVGRNSAELVRHESLDTSISSGVEDMNLQKDEVPDPTEKSNLSPSLVSDAASLVRTYDVETITDDTGSFADPDASRSTGPTATMQDYNSLAECSSEAVSDSCGTEIVADNKEWRDGLPNSEFGSNEDAGKSKTMVDLDTDKKLLDLSGATDANQPSKLAAACTQGILLLLQKAVEEGSALMLEEDYLDADNMYKRTVALAKSAPPAPVFRARPRKVVVRRVEKQEGRDMDTKETATVSVKDEKETQRSKSRRKGYLDSQCLGVVPQGSLGVDELAKLLT